MSPTKAVGDLANEAVDQRPCTLQDSHLRSVELGGEGQGPDFMHLCRLDFDGGENVGKVNSEKSL